MLRLTTLGALDVRDDRGHPLREVLRQPKRMALLVYLAVEGARGPVSREKLLALFWPESDTEHARNALSQLLHQLRVALGRDVFEAQGALAIRVSPAAVWCDAVAFQEFVARGESDMAVDLYRGEFCPALSPSGAPELEQWLDDQRRHLRTQALNAMAAAAERLEQRNDREGAILMARRTLAARPDDEARVRTLLTLLERLGDSAGALQAYAEYAQRLEADLETSPDGATRQLVDAIRRRRASPTPQPDAPAGSPPTTVAVEPGTYATPLPASAPRLTTRGTGYVRAARVTALGVIIVLASVSAALALRSTRDGGASRIDKTVAVFPFAIRGGPELGYLRHGMVDLLSAKLDGVSGLSAIDPRSAIAAAHREDTTAPAATTYGKLAGELGAGRYVAGDVVGVGDQVHINAALHEARSGRLVASASVVGPGANVLALVDGLTGRLLSRVTTGRDTILTRLGAVTTHSLPALVAFLAGEEALREGRDARAAEAFREATALDSTFALAHYRLSTTGSWVTLPEGDDLAVTAARAVRHASRLTPLARDLLGAYLAYRAVRADDAERVYRSIVDARPDNFEAWFMLAETRFHYNFFRGRSSAESRAAFERVLRVDPKNAHAVVHLARLAALEGRTESVDSLVRLYLDAHGGAGRALEMRALAAFVGGGAAAVSSVINATGDADDVLRTGIVQAGIVYAQNLRAIERMAPHVLSMRSPYYRAMTVRMLSEVALAGGRLARTKPAALLGAAFAEDWWLEGRALLTSMPELPLPPRAIAALRDSIARRERYPSLVQSIGPAPASYGPMMQTYLVGILSSRFGDSASANRALRGLEERRPGGDTAVAAGFAIALRAELARARGDAAGALRALESFAPAQVEGTTSGIARWSVRERFLRGELLREAGRAREAIAAFSSIEGTYDLPFIALAHLRRGQLHAQLGERGQAAFHYDRFLDMWRDCDPELRPLVESARVARERLKGAV